MEIIIASIVFFGLLLHLTMRIGLWRVLCAQPAPQPENTQGKPDDAQVLPPISVLKPLKGADPGLESNLASFFRLQYPRYQIVFGAESESDPAVAIVRKLMQLHPDVDCHLVVDDMRIGHNPKVNNLANIAQRAKFNVFVISDSNIRVWPGYLKNLASRLAEKDVGLVTSVFRATGGSGLGAELERLHLHTFVAGGIGAGNALFKTPVVVGKSMALTRATLEEIGDWETLADYLAEDQVCGELVHKLGKRVVVTHDAIDNTLGHMSMAAFLARHERWGILRKSLSFPRYVLELLFVPLSIALLGLLLAPSWVTLATVVTAWLGLGAMHASSERALHFWRPLAHYLWLVPLKEICMLVAWLSGAVQSTVEWRGRQYQINPGSRITPLASPQASLIPPSQASTNPVPATPSRKRAIFRRKRPAPIIPPPLPPQALAQQGEDNKHP